MSPEPRQPDCAVAREADALPSPVLNSGPGEAAATAPTGTASPALATLLTRHILQDGEVILLTLKPSLWFIPLSMLRFAAVVFIVVIASALYDEQVPGHVRVWAEFGLLVLGARLMWSALTWMGRLYILTNLRILRLSGVLQINIFDCPLRKVVRTRILRCTRERLFRLGSIEIIPSDEELPIGQWQMIGSPVQVNETIVAAINKARQGRNGNSH